MAGESNQTGSTVIEERQEDVIIGTRFEDSLVTTLNLVLLSLDNGKIVSRGDILTFVINNATFVDIDTGVLVGRLVEEGALEGVLRALSDIIVRENDNVTSFITLS